MRLHGLLRIHVNVLHEPARFICADRYQRKIDPWKTPADARAMSSSTPKCRVGNSEGVEEDVHRGARRESLGGRTSEHLASSAISSAIEIEKSAKAGKRTKTPAIIRRR
jgi:hypothetical protein